MVGALCFIWGSTWLVIKVSLEVVPPFFGAALRFALAAAILFGLARLNGVRPLRSLRGHAALLVVGVGTGVSYGAVYWGEQYITSGLSAVLFATHPLFVMILAHAIIATEPLTARKALGGVLGFAGVVLIFETDLQFTHPLGVTAALVTLLSPLTAATSNVCIKRWAHHIHPYNLTALPMGYAAVLLAAVALATENVSAVSWTAGAVAAIVYLAIFGSVAAFVMLYTLLKHIPVSLLALVSYGFPVVAVLLGFAILGETLEPQALAGAAAIVAGVAVATRAPARPAAGVALSLLALVTAVTLLAGAIVAPVRAQALEPRWTIDTAQSRLGLSGMFGGEKGKEVARRP
jgi:drug/metabolite transporter (DMT)-like permease